jgi:hypothetical protein
VNKNRRGAALTIFALLFGLLAISNFLKPIGEHARLGHAGFVFLGTRTSGIENAILGPLFGLILAAYAAGIWRMKKYALLLSYAYFAYVLLNLILFTAKASPGSLNGAFDFLFIPIGLAVPLAAAILLTYRRTELT